MLKEMGCNAIRTSHNPPAELLELTDQMGLLVMDEAFGHLHGGLDQFTEIGGLDLLFPHGHRVFERFKLGLQFKVFVCRKGEQLVRRFLAVLWIE